VTRRRWALAIFTAWAVALGWLVKREYFRSTGAKLAEAALAVPPGAVFYRLAVGGQQVGYAGTTIDTTRDTIRVTDVWVLDVPALGMMHRTDARSTASVSRALRMQGVDVTYDGDAGRWHAAARMVNDSSLRLTLTASGDSETTVLHVARAPVLPDLLPLRVAFGGELKTGRSVRVAVFDPLLLAEHDVSVTVAAESTLVVADSADYDSTAMAWVPVHYDTLQAFRLDQRGGLASSAWIDAQGHVVRAWTPGGFTVERTAFEIAYENFRHRDTLRLARATASPGPGDVIPLTLLAARAAPDRGPGRDSLRIRLAGVDVAGLDLAGGGQTMAGETLSVRRAAGAALRATSQRPARDTLLLPFLQVEPLIQHGDVRLRALARQIAGAERDPAAVAQLLARWVTANIKPAPAAGLASALNVLAARRGDCNERTVLYVALARAAGIPARPVAGLLAAGNRFYYHAWPEVYLGDWVPVDPTLGQFPADAAHLRFAIGGFARQLELVRVIGKLRLEVL
jgi:transglutaminase superfamily protein